MRRGESELPDRFDLLLPLRGVLALGIVLHHSTGVDFGVPQGRVVLFFLISGCCIFGSAEAALARSRGAMRWVGRRVWRLWPTYLLALACVGALGALGAPLHPAARPDRPLQDWIANVFVLAGVGVEPGPLHAAWHNPRLIVPAYWTLGYEVQFYALVALAMLIAPRVRRSLPCLAIGLCVGGVAATLLSPRTDHGLIFDYGVHFGIGAAVHYRGVLRVRASWRRFAVEAGLSAMLLVGVAGMALLPMEGRAGRYAPAELAVSSAVGLLLIALRRRDASIARSLSLAPLRAAGRISYSVFLVHAITMPMARRLVRAAPGIGDAPGLNGAALLAFHLIAGAAFWAVCERPFVGGSRWSRILKGSDAARVASGRAAYPVSAMLNA